MIVKKVELQCPNCHAKIKILKAPHSAGHFGSRTDLSGAGLALITPSISECRRCGYLFCDPKLVVDKEKLNSYIRSDEYKSLLKSEDKKFLIVYSIYKNVGLPLKMQNKILLYNYYKTKEIEYLKLLADNYISFLNEHVVQDKDFLFSKMMIGEYYRRIEEFEKSKEIFLELVNLKISKEYEVVDKCKFQLHLIAEKDKELHKFPS